MSRVIASNGQIESRLNAIEADVDASWQVLLDHLSKLNAEAEAVARALDDPVILCSALRGEAFLAACRGDRERMVEKHEAMQRTTDGLRRPLLTWRALNDMAAFEAFAGDIERADRLTMDAADLGRRTEVSDSFIMGSLGALLYAIRMAQGRIGELVPILEGLVESQPGLPVWRVAIAGALVESDRVDEARPHFDYLADNDCANVPADVEFPVTVCGLGRLSYRIGPSETVARSILERLEPFSGTFNFSGATVTDPNDLGLAMVTAALGRHDEADQYFADVIGLCERAGAQAYLARSHLDWARIRHDRADRAGAREHAEIALEMGTALGMTGAHGVAPRAAALLAGA
jgi:hypothetical protein